MKLRWTFPPSWRLACRANPRNPSWDSFLSCLSKVPTTTTVGRNRIWIKDSDGRRRECTEDSSQVASMRNRWVQQWRAEVCGVTTRMDGVARVRLFNRIPSKPLWVSVRIVIFRVKMHPLELQLKKYLYGLSVYPSIRTRGKIKDQSLLHWWSVKFAQCVGTCRLVSHLYPYNHPRGNSQQHLLLVNAASRVSY